MIYTLNGIGNSDPTDRMAVALHEKGQVVQPLYYPLTRWHQTGSLKRQYETAKALLQDVDKGGHIIAHSYGALLAARMMELGGSNLFRTVILFAPALNRDWVFPLEAFSTCWVVSNPQDRAVWYAKYFFRHAWGAMGRYGYVGDDPRIYNWVDTLNLGMFARHHAHYFSEAHVGEYANQVLEWLYNDWGSGQ